MVAGERRRLHGEIAHEDRPVELVAAQVLPQLLDQFAVQPALALRHVEPDGGGKLFELLYRRIDGDGGLSALPRELRVLRAQRLVERGIHLHRLPLATEVVRRTIGELYLRRAEDLHRDLLDDLADHRRRGVVVAVGHVPLEHRELGRVRGVHALVAEVAVDLEDPLEPADHAALEVQLGRDAQVQVDVEGVRVRDERARRRAAVQRLQHRCLDLEESAPFERVAQRADHSDAHERVAARGRTHDEIVVALAHTRVLAELLVRDRQRSQRLRGELPRIGHDRQFPALGTHDPSRHGHEIAEVHIGLPRVERLLSDVREGQHRLELRRHGVVIQRSLRVDAILETHEGELAGIAKEQHATGDGHNVFGFFAVGQFRVARIGDDVAQRGRARDRHRVRLGAAVQNLRPLLAANAELFGRVIGLIAVGCDGGGGRILGLGVALIVHDIPG